MEPLRTAPEASSFVPIAEHQSRTPSSFHEGPPVLHYHSQRCKVVVLEGDLLSNPALNALRNESAAANGTTTETDEHKEISIDDVDTWVGSEKFILYSPKTSTGITIPYPSISVHAIQRLTPPNSDSDSEVQGLYMQIATHATPSSEDEEEQCITLTVIPPPQTAEELAQAQDGDEPETPIQKLYAAVSACSNLHPDPVEPGDEDEDEEGKGFSIEQEQGGLALYQLGREVIGGEEGENGLPPPVDGSSGWITAENMHEFIDEEGNWIGEGEPPAFPLGPGAGNVHGREDVGGEGEGDGEEEDETKWRRTE